MNFAESLLLSPQGLTQEQNNLVNKMEAIINYSLNKFCPLLVIGFIVFSQFGIATWEPWVVMGMVLFAERFNYNSGYAVAYCEKRGIPFE